MAVVMSLRIVLVLILVPAVAASSGGDAFSNNLFSGITPLLALFGQDFANHFLSQSTSWLDSIIFATGPLGIPAAITAAIRVGGYSFLKGLIGRAGERESTVEKDLLSSTSRDVCELWDGKKVVRLEATDPFIQELLYFGKNDKNGEEWYNLRDALKEEFLVNEKEHGDVESPPKPESKGTVPSNILLNLIDDSRSWEHGAGAILGVILQSTVLIVAGLTTFYPHWKRQFSVQLYEFCCMAGRTALLTFGLIICASVVEQRTQEETYVTSREKPETLSILWLQRGRSDTDQSFDPCIFGVDRERIRTSRLATRDPSSSLKLWTLVGTVAATLGFLLQFIGLIGMHWPTQVAQFTITLIMTGIRAFIRRAPRAPDFYQPIENELNTISDKYEMDWLASKPKGKKFADIKDNQHIEHWQLMTAGCLSEVQEEENNQKGIEDQQLVLKRRQRLGTLCGWTGMARKWAICLATAIDGVTNILLTDAYPEDNFEWFMDFKVGATTKSVSFEIKRLKRHPWESNFTQLEAALSLGLFGDKLTVPNVEDPEKSKEDWLRSDENMERKAQCVRLLSPSTTVALRDLTWWLGPQTRRLKEVSLRTDGDEMVKIEPYRLLGFGTSGFDEEASFGVQRHRIAGPRGTSGTSALGRPSIDPVDLSKHWCFAAISEADLGLLYAQHMFSAFMQAITKQQVIEFSKAAIEKKWKFIPSQRDSWNSIQLSEKSIENLVLCVQRAGLADMEDAYLSIIAPLSKEAKLPSLEEVFNVAWERIIQDQSQERWDDAYTGYHLLWKTFVTSSKPDEMAVKTTALLMEFLRLFHKKLREAPAVALNEGEEALSVNSMKNTYKSIKEMLKTADEDVLHHLADLYAMQGWPDVGDELARNHRENNFQLETLQPSLKQTRYHYAAMRGDLRCLFRRIERGRQTHIEEDLFGRTFLHYVARKRNDEIRASSEELEAVIQSMRHCIDHSDCFGMTALHAAAETGNAALIGVLVEHGADKDKAFEGRTALHIAAELDHAEVVQKLLKFSADTGVQTRYGRYTPFHLAVLGGHDKVVAKLIRESGADAVDRLGRQALHLAAASGKKPMVEQLFEHDNGTLHAKDTNGWTAWHWAAMKGDTNMVSALLEKGASLGATNGGGWTVLHFAASQGHTYIVKLLLEVAATREGSVYRDGGKNQDEHAHTYDSVLLGEIEALVNAKNFYSKTALHYAVEHGHEMIVRMLLEHDAVYEMDKRGIEALSGEVNSGYKAAVGNLLHALLLKKGATFDVTDTGRRKALHWAEQESWREGIVQMVLELLQEQVKLGKAPDSAALEPGREAVCVFLQEVLGDGKISGPDTDTSGSIAEPQTAETKLTPKAEVLEILESIKEILRGIWSRSRPEVLQLQVSASSGATPA